MYNQYINSVKSELVFNHHRVKLAAIHSVDVYYGLFSLVELPLFWSESHFLFPLLRVGFSLLRVRNHSFTIWVKFHSKRVNFHSFTLRE